MGQLVTTVVGGAIGFAIGGPLGAQIGMTLGGMIGSTLFGPTIKGPRLNDLKVTASTYGTAIPEIYGTVRVGGNMIWTTGIKETSKKSRPGKGGPKQVTYSYDATFAMGLCKGPIQNVLRIWADGKIIYDKTGGATRTPEAAGTSGGGTLGGGFFPGLFIKIAQKKKPGLIIRVYRGDEEQLPDSLIVADKGVGNVSAHRGIAYVVFERMQLEDYGNRIPQLTFEITKRPVNSLPSTIATQSGSIALPTSSSYELAPIWTSEKLIIGELGQTRILDAQTMRLRATNPSYSSVFNNRKRYIPELNILMTSNNTFNSSPIVQYSLNDLTEIQRFGIQGNGSLSGFVNVVTEEYSLGNLGPIGFCRHSKGTQFITSNFWGWTWGFTNGGKYPNFVDKETPFRPEFYYEGQTGLSSSFFVGYRNANDRVELLLWDVKGSANYTIEQTPSGPEWKSSDDWQRQQINLVPFPGERYEIAVCHYDKTDDSIFSMGRSDGVSCVFKWQRSTGEYRYRIKHPGLDLPESRMHYSRLAGDTFAWIVSAFAGRPAQAIEIDMNTGAIARRIPVGEIFGNSSFIVAVQQQWDDVTKSVIIATGGVYRRIYFGNTVEEFSVAEIIEDVCLKTGVLTLGQIDTSEIDDSLVVGYMIDRETTARDVLRQLATGFLFDGYESDYKLKFKSRGAASVVSIPEDWIARDQETMTIKQTITQELEMPMRVSVNFYDISRDHQQGSQTQKRKAGPVPTMWTNREEIIDLPITWTPDQGKRCADKILKMLWANRENYQFSLPWRYLKYDPSDVATVNLEDGTVFTMRFNEATIGVDFSMEINASSEKAGAYVSNATGATSDAPLPFIPNTFPVYPVLINTPLLRDIDYNTSGNSVSYLSAGTDSYSFTGAIIYIDEGYDYVTLGGIDRETVTGNALSILPNTTAYESTDETTRLIVSLDNPENLLESVTQEAMLNNNLNAALVGNEVIQFRNATQNSNGTWTLSGILRARRGTNYAVNNHVMNEFFVLLDEDIINSFRRPPSDYFISRDFKAVPPGTLLEDAQAYNFTLVPRDLMPYTPEDIKLVEASGTVTISMSRRSRVTAPLENFSGVIHYKEGERSQGRIEYKIWLGLDLDDIDTTTDPALAGQVPLFDSSGNDIPATFDFALTALGGSDKFLIRLAEIGVVEGTPKWVAFERLSENRWNEVDLY